mgnify:CR=1 FL=1
MTEEKLVEEILEIASELDRGDITFDEAQIKAQTLVRIDRYEQLIIPDVVKSFTTDEVLNVLDSSYELIDAISFFEYYKK